VPIAFALAGAGVLGIWLITGDLNTLVTILGTAPFSTVAEYTLTTIPMFVLMAYFSASSGLARDLFNAAASWLSHIRGGLAIATVFACGIFGAMSGASVAGASVMSAIAMPHMRRYGYSEELGSGAIAVGSTLVILIPRIVVLPPPRKLPSVNCSLPSADIVLGILLGPVVGRSVRPMPQNPAVSG
jgi:TRAP-type mannitol/chloroaromatic compound transport system permease large subunit